MQFVSRFRALEDRLLERARHVRIIGDRLSSAARAGRLDWNRRWGEAWEHATASLGPALEPADLRLLSEFAEAFASAGDRERVELRAFFWEHDEIWQHVPMFVSLATAKLTPAADAPWLRHTAILIAIADGFQDPRDTSSAVWRLCDQAEAAGLDPVAPITQAMSMCSPYANEVDGARHIMQSVLKVRETRRRSTAPGAPTERRLDRPGR